MLLCSTSTLAFFRFILVATCSSERNFCFLPNHQHGLIQADCLLFLSGGFSEWHNTKHCSSLYGHIKRGTLERFFLRYRIDSCTVIIHFILKKFLCRILFVFISLLVLSSKHWAVVKSESCSHFPLQRNVNRLYSVPLVSLDGTVSMALCCLKQIRAYRLSETPVYFPQRGWCV